MSSNLPYIALLDGPAADVLDFFQRRASWHISDHPNSTSVRLDGIAWVALNQFNRLPTVLYNLSVHPLHPRRVVHRVLAGWRSPDPAQMMPPGAVRALNAAGVGPALLPDPFRPDRFAFPFLEASYTTEETARSGGRPVHSELGSLSFASSSLQAFIRSRSSSTAAGAVVDIAMAYRPRRLFGIPIAGAPPTPSKSNSAPSTTTSSPSSSRLPPVEFLLGAQVAPAMGSGNVSVGTATTLCDGSVRVAVDADVFRRISSSVLVTPFSGVQVAARVCANLITSSERFAVGGRVVAGPALRGVGRLFGWGDDAAGRGGGGRTVLSTPPSPSVVPDRASRGSASEPSRDSSAPSVPLGDADYPPRKALPLFSWMSAASATNVDAPRKPLPGVELVTGRVQDEAVRSGADGEGGGRDVGSLQREGGGTGGGKRGVLGTLVGGVKGTVAALGAAGSALIDVEALEAHAVLSCNAGAAGVAVPLILPLWPWRLYVSWGIFAPRRTAQGVTDVRTLICVWTDACVYEPSV